jgi:hypothetical protein
MKVYDFEGKSYQLKLHKREYSDVGKSSGHLECRKLLKEIYPSDNVFEEIHLTPHLIVDFLLPLRKLMVEIQGQQHFEFNKFFHGNKIKFNDQKTRDSQKREWALINNFVLLELKYEDKDNWKKLILGAFDVN